MSLLSMPAEVLDHICSSAGQDKDRSRRLTSLYNLSLTCKALYKICTPYLYKDIHTNNTSQLALLVRTLKDDPKLDSHVRGTLKITDILWRSTLGNDFLQYVLAKNYNIDALDISVRTAVRVPTDIPLIAMPLLGSLRIRSDAGISRSELARLIEFCPKLEKFEYQEIESDEYHDIEPVSPYGIATALRLCEDTLRSLVLNYNQYCHITNDGTMASHSEVIAYLGHFRRLEHLEISANDIFHLDPNYPYLPASLKTLSISFVDSSMVDELEALARVASQLLPKLQTIRIQMASGNEDTSRLPTEFKAAGIQLIIVP